MFFHRRDGVVRVVLAPIDRRKALTRNLVSRDAGSRRRRAAAQGYE